VWFFGAMPLFLCGQILKLDVGVGSQLPLLPLVWITTTLTTMRERKILVSRDGLGRIAIVERSDGLFLLYERWLWSCEQQKAWNVSPVLDRRWDDGSFDGVELYDERSQPMPGLFDCIERAEAEARSNSRFADALNYRP